MGRQTDPGENCDPGNDQHRTVKSEPILPRVNARLTSNLRLRQAAGRSELTGSSSGKGAALWLLNIALKQSTGRTVRPASTSLRETTAAIASRAKLSKMMATVSVLTGHPAINPAYTRPLTRQRPPRTATFFGSEIKV